MNTNQIVNEIKNCHAENCGLRQQTCITLGTPPDSESNYSFYYNDSDLKTAKYICIMQNPNLGNGYKDSKEFQDYQNWKGDIVELHKIKLWEWLSKDHRVFLGKFLKSIANCNLPISNYLLDQEHLNIKVMDDFIFTDIVKCRARTSEITRFTEVCLKKHLDNELKNIGKGKLIFVFSSRAWSQIFKTYKLKLYNLGSGAEMNFKITNSHGRLFYSPILESYFIPLAHFSQTQFNNYLRNSYFEYFEEGLSEYSKII